MKKNSAFINSARGPIIRESEMICALKERPDVTAFLDLTEKEPAEKENPLYEMENVILTPHIAGSTGKEKARMGRSVIHDLENYLKGEPMQYAVSLTDLQTRA